MLRQVKFEQFLKNKAMARELNMYLAFKLAADKSNTPLTTGTTIVLNKYYSILKNKGVLTADPTAEELSYMKQLIEASL